MIYKDDDFDILVIRDYYPSYQNPTNSTWVFQQVKYLQKSGYHPLVISPTPIIPFRRYLSLPSTYEKPNTNIDYYENTAVIRPPYIKIPDNKAPAFTLKNLSKVICKYGNSKSIRLVHSHFGQNGIAAVKLKKNLNVPLITSFYGYDSGRLGKHFLPYYNNLKNNGDLFLVLSEDMKKDLINLGFPKEKILIHHLGIDINEFNINNKHKNDNLFNLLTIARFDEGKGIHIVLDAINLLFKLNPSMKDVIKYHIVGGGKYEEILKNIINKYDLSNNVEIIHNLGVKNGREIVKNELSKADVFILCSYTTKNGTKEGTPVVLMEAQACGLPCIATKHAGIPEIIINGETGILINENNSEEIYNAILTLYNNNELLHNMGEKGRENIINNFNLKNK